MILVKKLQQGGEFAPTKLSSGIFDRSAVLLNNTQRAGNTAQAPRSNGGTRRAAAKPPTNALQSDLLAYNAQKEKLNTELNDLVSQGISTESPTYQAALEARYALDTQTLPAMKAKAIAYNKASTAVKSHNAAGAPAILGDKVMVFDKTAQEYEIINSDDLLNDSKNYRISNIGEAMTQRANNVKFTGELGNFVDSLMNNAYGQQQFNKSLEASVMGLGYSLDADDNLLDDNNKSFDINSIGFTDGKLAQVTPQAVNFINGLAENASNSQSNYAAGVALQQLHTRLLRDDKTIDIKNLPQELNDLRSTFLFKQGKAVLSRKLKYGAAGASSGGSGGSGKGKEPGEAGDISKGKNIILNNVNLAAASIGNTESIETVAGVEKTNALYQVPTSKVDRGIELIERGWSDKIDKEGTYLKPHNLANNTFLSNVPNGDLAKSLTTAGGERIVDFTHSGELSSVTVAPGGNLRLIIAPMTFLKDGTKVVNFNSENNAAILDGVKKANAIFKKHKISTEDVSAGIDKEKLSKAKSEIDALKLDVNGTVITFGMAFAVDVLFGGTSSARDNAYISERSNLTSSLAKLVGDESVSIWDVRTSVTKAFIPLGDIYWRSSYAQDSNIPITFHPSQLQAALHSDPDISKQDNKKFTKKIVSDTNSETKKNGGKLDKNDAIYQLLH